MEIVKKGNKYRCVETTEANDGSVVITKSALKTKKEIKDMISGGELDRLKSKRESLKEDIERAKADLRTVNEDIVSLQKDVDTKIADIDNDKLKEE